MVVADGGMVYSVLKRKHLINAISLVANFPNSNPKCSINKTILNKSDYRLNRDAIFYHTTLILIWLIDLSFIEMKSIITFWKAMSKMFHFVFQLEYDLADFLYIYFLQCKHFNWYSCYSHLRIEQINYD